MNGSCAAVCCFFLILHVPGMAFADASKPSSPWDPQLVQTLPPEMNQGLDGLPAHLYVAASADYSFGTANGLNGLLYFTEFKGTLLQLSPQGELTRRAFNRPGAYGVSADSEGNVFVAFDSDRKTGGIVRISATGDETPIVDGLTRPRQLACDAHGNVYFVLEGERAIRRWNKADGTVETVLGGLNCPQGVAVGSDGSVYFSEYGVFGERGVALEAGSVHVLRPDGNVTKLAGGFWRARGIALALNGDVYVAGEANAWDQGNSGAIFRISPAAKVDVVVQGLDYPQVPAVTPDGKIHFGVCRDNLLLAYDTATAFESHPWPGQPGIEIGVSGGTWTPEGDENDGPALELTISDVVLKGQVRASAPQRVVRIWVRVPADRMNVSRAELPHPSAESHLPGMYRLPSVECPGAERLTVMPARTHLRSRWPVRYNDAGTEIAAEGFDEAPEAYLVYMEYRHPDSIEKGN